MRQPLRHVLGNFLLSEKLQSDRRSKNLPPRLNRLGIEASQHTSLITSLHKSSLKFNDAPLAPLEVMPQKPSVSAQWAEWRFKLTAVPVAMGGAINTSHAGIPLPRSRFTSAAPWRGTHGSPCGRPALPVGSVSIKNSAGLTSQFRPRDSVCIPMGSNYQRVQARLFLDALPGAVARGRM